MKILRGNAASSGISIASAYVFNKKKLEIIKKHMPDSNLEIEKFLNAVEVAKKQIQKLRNYTKLKIGEEKAQIFDTHLEMVMDPELFDQIIKIIRAEQCNISFALKLVIEEYRNFFNNMADDYMRERATDIEDIGERLLNILENKKKQDLSAIDKEVIIFAKDLTPSETTQLNKTYVKGFVTEVGGVTSHSAIVARGLGIPAIVGVANVMDQINEDDSTLLDGDEGEIIINPTEKQKSFFFEKAKLYEKNRKEEQHFVNKPAITKDDWKMKVAFNIGNEIDLKEYQKLGGDGVGLFRTEFLYMEKDHWPTEEEQFQVYKKILSTVKELVVIRTLDIGGDKKLNYYQFPKEENPFLGYRAIRLQLDQRDIFKAQIRALLRAAPYGNLAINLPMIATIDELKTARDFIEKCEKELKKEKIKIGNYQLGMMVEIPSAVVLADKFIKYVDFFSIGTNDLIQYTFAADRNSEKVSYLYQPFNPIILKEIKTIIDASHKKGKWTAICGEMAREPKLVPLFIAMELDELSMSSSGILKIRRLLSKINKKDTQELLEKILELETEKEVKTELDNYFEKRKIIY